ncbi:MAG: hypothetical protein CVU64_17575 [Deltaproteobacteria bacterium HGW-Deltaproteobacteria-21]|nr:MAG: hypothetical protein CVU64_17575 [Deltaproteobacteria bacterium HGW-Deltaproteobacteria-21]
MSKKAIHGDTHHVNGPEKSDHPRNLGGRPKGAVGPSGEDRVKKAIERIIERGSRLFTGGKLTDKGLNALSKTIESYTSLLKLTAKPKTMTDEETLKTGRVGAYESLLVEASRMEGKEKHREE